jgi:hypothetical protein
MVMKGRKLSPEHRAAVAAVLERCRELTRIRYELNGQSQTLTEWSRETGIPRATLRKRIQRGVPFHFAICP